MYTLQDIDRFRARIIQKLPDKKAALLTDCGIYHVGTLLSVLLSVSQMDSILPVLLGILKHALDRWVEFNILFSPNPGNITTGVHILQHNTPFFSQSLLCVKFWCI